MAKTKGLSTPFASNQDYQAQSDARTLMDAAMIKKDKARHAPALKHASKMAKEKMEEAKELKKLGNKPRY